MQKINQKIEDFELEAFHSGKIKKIKSADCRGKWLILFFYPADFTFVCPTELGELADYYKKFQELGAEVMSISTDTVFVHKAWYDQSPTIKKIEFPMLADPAGKVSRQFGVYIEEEGLALRGTFIINPEGTLVSSEVRSNNIGRNVKELLRTLQAAKFVSEHNGSVCPANWEPGKDTLEPGLDLVGKI